MKGKRIFSGLLSLLMVVLMMVPVTIEAAEHEHDYTYEQKVVKQYTCTTVGMVKNLCSCGAYKFEQIQPHHTESFEEPYTKEPTCGETGIADKVCSVCGELLEADAEVPATGEHDYKEGVRPATCTVPERTGKICTVCGQADGNFTESGEALGHSWGEPVVKAATCEVSGESVVSCTREGCNEKQVTVIPPLGHNWQDGDVVDADCEHGAGVVQICKNGCGETYVDEFTEPGLAAPALGHHWVTDAAIAATCEGVGYTPYHCDREGCDAVTKNAIVPALGHSLEKKVVDPTCQDEGYSVSECAVCGYESEKFDKKEADPDAHVLVPSDTVIVEAGCTTNGLVQLKCDVCGETEFAEKDYDFNESDVELGDNEIEKTKRYKVIPAGHTWDEGKETPATCTQAGVIAYTCTVDGCGAVSDVALKALGHVTAEAVSKAATCGEAGEMTIICTRECCKDEEGQPLVLESGIVIPTTGEHEFVDETVEPTCTEVGKVAYRCKNCGKMDDDWFEYAPALGHDWEADEENSVPATCTQAGVKAEKCSRCDATQSSVDPIIDHNWVSPDDAGITEDEDGNDISLGYLDADCEHAFCEVQVCSICKQIRKDYAEEEEFGPLGHIPVTGATVEPTCVTGGYVEMSCSREGCNATWAAAQTQPLGHDIKNEVVPANCKERGYTTHKCSRCDYAESNTDYTPINPDNHVPTAKVVKEQTCTVNGVQKLTCEKCGTSMGYQIIVADHRWDEGTTTTEATCTGPGVKTYSCASCDAVSTEAIAAKGHTEVVSASQAATCVEAGWKEASCSVCGADLGRIEIPATGIHDFQDDQYIDATCTEPLKIGRLCSVCYEPESEDSYVTIGEALGHNMSTLQDTEHTQVLTPAACGVSGVAVICCLNEGCDLTQSAVIPAMEHDFDMDVSDTELRPAGCENPAYYVEYCQNENCEATRAWVEPEINGVTNAALGHNWVIRDEILPSCTAAGVVVYECTREGCNVTREAVSGSALNHDLTTVSVEPTCQDEGYTAEKCTRCDYEGEHTNIIPAESDAHVAEGVNPPIKAASCTVGGVRKLVCKYCGKAMGYESILPSHTWGEATIEKEATCTQEGVQAMTCTVAGCGVTTRAAIEAKGHTEEEHIDVAGTCGRDGKKSIVCTVCNEVIQEDIVIPATGKHQFDDDNFLDPTCTEPGKVGTICSVCGAIDGDYFEFGEPLGHDWDEENPEVVSEAACEVSGMAVIHCTHDGCEVTRSAVIPALAHDWSDYSDDSYHEADCEFGDYAIVKCTHCGSSMKEEIGINPALGHNWVTKEAVEATCVSGGYVIMECTRSGCEATMQAAETKALGHDWEVKVIPPNCTNDGYTADVCNNCGAEGEHTNIVPSSEELHVAVSGAVLKEATCKSAGVRKLVCAGCGKAMGYETILAAPHTWGDAQVTTPATCTKPGEQTVTCTVCGKTETQEIPAAGHDVDMDEVYFDDDITAIWYQCRHCAYVVFDEQGFIGDYRPFDWITTDHINNHQVMAVTDEAIAPTETTEGKTEGSHCKICNAVIVPQQTIPATGQLCDHVYGDAYEVVDVDGVRMLRYTCEKCGNIHDEACTHSYGDPEVVEDENGKMVFKYVCDICGSSYTEEM